MKKMLRPAATVFVKTLTDLGTINNIVWRLIAKKRLTILIAVSYLVLSSHSTASGRFVPSLCTVSTVAGNGSAGYSGDNGQSINAALNTPYSVAVDTDGYIFIADFYNYRVRKVNTIGVISTVAGNGQIGFTSGDGGNATNAIVFSPSAVAVDSAGNIFIAEVGASRIRKANTSGIISTIAGVGGQQGYSGDGGQATAAQLDSPWGIAVDSAGNIFIADSGNNRIRKIDTFGIITTVAGNGARGSLGDGGNATAASLEFPTGIAVDSVGNIFIQEQYRIRKIDESGIISTVAGIGPYGNLEDPFYDEGGPATEASLCPVGIAVDANGNIFISDSFAGRIRKVDTSGIILTLAARYEIADGIPVLAGSPQGLTLDPAGNIFVAIKDNNYIQKISFNTNNTLATSESDCLFTWGENNYPSALSPSRPASLASSPYYFRYYSGTNTYLGYSSADEHLYFLNGANGQLSDLGLAATWATQAGCR